MRFPLSQREEGSSTEHPIAPRTSAATRRLAALRLIPRSKGLALRLALSAALCCVGVGPAHAQNVDFSAFTPVDWYAQHNEPTGFTALQYTATGNDLTVPIAGGGAGAGNSYAALVSASDAVSAPGEVFEMSLVFNDPNADDDWWGMTFGLQPGDQVDTDPSGAFNNDADWVTWSWKALDQEFQTGGPISDQAQFGGTPMTGTGMQLAEIQGIIAYNEFGARQNNAGTPGSYRTLASPIAGTPGESSYQGAVGDKQCVRTRYSTEGITVWVNGIKTMEYDVATDAGRTRLPTGSWGLMLVAENGITLRAGQNLCPGDHDRDDSTDVVDEDDDNDGVLDVNEVAPALLEDTNSNGVVDFADVELGSFVDTNGDGIDDRADTDMDGAPNHLDLDSDGDGIFDLLEGNDADGDRENDNTTVVDADNDGMLDDLGADTNGNGVHDSYDTTPAAGQDSSSPSNSIPDFLDPNSAPEITSAASLDVEDGETVVATLTFVDPEEDPSSFAIVGGADAGAFTLTEAGELALVTAKDSTSPDDDNADGDYELNVSVCEDTAPTSCDTQSIIVTLVTGNRPPAITSVATINVEEGETAILSVTATDPEGDTPLTFSVSGGPDAGLVSIDSGTGVLVFDTAPDASAPTDDDGNGVYIIEVSVCDPEPLCSTATVEVTVTRASPVNLPPEITSNGGGDTASAGFTAGATAPVTTLTATDPNGDAVTFSVSGGTDSGRFAIGAGNTLVFSTAPSTMGDANSDGVYQVSVQACDPSAACDEQTLSISVSTADRDGDGVGDDEDSAPDDPSLCADADSDSCDDCSITGANGSGGDTSGDGPDGDGDGICDAGDPDDDNDGVLDADDSDPTNPSVCADADSDNCDDCSVTGADSSGGNVLEDGPDSNSDGQCDAAMTDADGDGVLDAEDGDTDNDGIPDAVEGTADSDGDGIPNHKDLDSDNDGILDIVEDGNGAMDTDGDGRLDDVTDADGDGLAASVDADDSNPGAQSVQIPTQDSDGDGVIDALDLDSDDDGLSDVVEAGGSELDQDEDGRLDSAEDENLDGVMAPVDPNENSESLPVPDTDGDGIPDFQDLDSDADGVPDLVEGHDENLDGIPDTVPSGVDANGDGWDDAFDPNLGGVAAPLPDSDSDGIANFLDPDDDGDGILTGLEDVNLDGDPRNDNSDGDEHPNYLDPDDDGDGVLTKNEGSDPNGDGNPDDAVGEGEVPNFLTPAVGVIENQPEVAPEPEVAPKADPTAAEPPPNEQPIVSPEQAEILLQGGGAKCSAAPSSNGYSGTWLGLVGLPLLAVGLRRRRHLTSRR